MDTKEPIAAESTRLNKYLASVLAIGRRQADTLITQGAVLVNGEKPELGSRVTGAENITVRGKPLRTDQQTPVYLALNKPAGYVCSRRQQGGTPTIYTLLPAKYQHLKPVGRLDKDSSGLLLLTNDGDFAHHMTHPSFHKVKIYETTLSQPLTPLHRQMIAGIGVTLTDGVSKFGLHRTRENDDTSWIVTMHEGRNRQIRRTFAALGYKVTRLHRVQFGKYALDTLQPGKSRSVT
jgi:23S rRNA pseudouridine2605 synthase